MAVIAVGTTGLITSVITIFAGILVLAFPTFLRFLIGFYLLLVGVIGLLAAI